MNQKTVLGLGVAALAAIAIAAAVTGARKPASEATRPVDTYALPELRDHLNDVKSLSVTGAGNQLIVTVEKSDKGWSVKERGGYAADVGKVREYLTKLADAKLVEAKTSSDKRYADLGVDDIGAAGAKGMLVAVDGLGKPAQLIVGSIATRGDATYVRRAGDKQSWLARGAIVPDKNTAMWLSKAVADIPATRVKEVVLVKPDGKRLRVYKDAESDANFKVADVPKGRELSSEFAANSIGTTLAALNLDDVATAAQAAPPADGKVYKANITTFDGVTVAIEAWQDGEKHQARIVASFDAAAADGAIAAAQAKAKAEFDAKPAPADGAAKPEPPLAVTDPAKDKEQRIKALADEVAAIKARTEGWTIVLPQHKFANIDKSVDDLLKPVEEKKGEVKKK
jgi:hypothetical protein